MGYIYFTQYGGARGPIKVGFTCRSVEIRAFDLSSDPISYPLDRNRKRVSAKLLFAMRGTLSDEQVLHSVLRPWRRVSGRNDREVYSHLKMIAFVDWLRAGLSLYACLAKAIMSFHRIDKLSQAARDTPCRAS